MRTLNEELTAAKGLDADAFDKRFAPNPTGHVNGLSARDCPPGHAMLRQPASSEKDIRVTIPASIMQGWKPPEWASAGVKNKKIALLLDSENSGLLAVKPVTPETVGKGIYRLEQSKEDGQARFMTTRSYTCRVMSEKIVYVPFEIEGPLGLLDLRELESLTK